MTQNEIIGHKIAEWFHKNARILPWRKSNNIYFRLVSEFMLQQTQVSTVLPYFNRWITILPTIESLAHANESEVLKLWEGLGYYSRARNLLKAAQKIISDNHWPETVTEWKQLPGVGEYTACALTSIAQNQIAAALDGNVIRVLCRINAIKDRFPNKESALKILRPIAQSYIPKAESSTYNEGIIEFGALICKPQKPNCPDCPILDFCKSFHNNLTINEIPSFSQKIIKNREIKRAFFRLKGKIALVKSTNRRLKNLYELPTLELFSDLIKWEKISEKNRSITNEKITEKIFSPILNEDPNTFDENFDEVLLQDKNLELVPENKLDQITLSGPHKRWIKELL